MDYRQPLTPITFKASPALAERLERLARDTKRSRSQVVRLILEQSTPHVAPWPYRQEPASDRH